MILARLLMRLMGQKSVTLSAPSFLGCKTSKRTRANSAGS
jgi:hypothetical protein